MDEIKYKVENGYIYFDAERNMVYGCDSTVTAIDIPTEINGIRVEEICDHAFVFNSNLKRISIPPSVTYIGDDAFLDCEALERIDVDDANFRYTSVDGILYKSEVKCNDEGKHILIKKEAVAVCGGGYKGSRVEIPEGVSYLYINAFRGCKNIESIKLPDSLKFFCSGAFEDCTGLKEINIPESVDDIPAESFAGCEALQSIELHQGVKRIARDAFAGCTSLKRAEIKNKKAVIAETAFKDCTALENKAEIEDMIKNNAALRGNSFYDVLKELGDIL